MDTITKEHRSWNMKQIKSKDTKPELFIRHELWHKGIRYKKNCTSIFGHPDIYISKDHCAVFVHGCFWHRHFGCKYAYTPKSRIDFWKKKFQSNIDRDRTVRETLKSQGIRMIIIWECTAKKAVKDNAIITDIYNEIVQSGSNRFNLLHLLP